MKTEYLPMQYMKKLRERMRLYFISSIFIGVLLSIFASSFVAMFSVGQDVVFGTTAIMLCCVAIWYLYRYRTELSREYKIHGTVFYSKDKNELMQVPRYVFAEHLKGNMKALFAESPNDKKMWDKQKLSFPYGNKRKDDNFSVLLLRENIEYIILETLSITLTDFYNDKQFKKLHTYCRNDIPDVLIGNRFLFTFSKDLNQRSSFNSMNKKDNEKTPGVIVMAIGGRGAMYNRFELTLPKKSKVHRDNNTIIIETPMLELALSLDLEGYSDLCPTDFEKYYLKSDFLKTGAYRADISVNIKFKFWKSFKDTETHQWVDKFVKSLYESVDIEEFYRRINWEGNLFVLSQLLSERNK